MPRLSQRLGMVYCFNRPAVLYYTPWPQPTPVPGGVPGGITHATPPHAAPPALRLTPPTVKHACLAMFSPDGGRLVVLSHDAAVGSGVHHATGALLSADWPVCCAWEGGGGCGGGGVRLAHKVVVCINRCN